MASDRFSVFAEIEIEHVTIGVVVYDWFDHGCVGFGSSLHAGWSFRGFLSLVGRRLSLWLGGVWCNRWILLDIFFTLREVLLFFYNRINLFTGQLVDLEIQIFFDLRFGRQLLNDVVQLIETLIPLLLGEMALGEELVVLVAIWSELCEWEFRLLTVRIRSQQCLNGTQIELLVVLVLIKMLKLVVINVEKHILLTQLGELDDLSHNTDLTLIETVLTRSPFVYLLVQVDSF